MGEVGGDGEVKQGPRQLEEAEGPISLQPQNGWQRRAPSRGHRGVWVGPVGVGRSSVCG